MGQWMPLHLLAPGRQAHKVRERCYASRSDLAANGPSSGEAQLGVHRAPLPTSLFRICPHRVQVLVARAQARVQV